MGKEGLRTAVTVDTKKKASECDYLHVSVAQSFYNMINNS